MLQSLTIFHILELLQRLNIEDIADSSRDVSPTVAFFCNEKAEKQCFDIDAIKNGCKVVIKIRDGVGGDKTGAPYPEDGDQISTDGLPSVVKRFGNEPSQRIGASGGVGKGNIEIIERHFHGNDGLEKIFFEIALPHQKYYITLLQNFYKTDEIKKIGITGTNGKSSTVHFGATLCSLYGRKSATVGTNGVCIFENGSLVSKVETGLTTPMLTQNHRILANLQKAGVEFVWMEVSSIGIHQGRVDGIMFDASCFTNLTQDHLDYHQTMNEYFLQKLRLFTEFTKSLVVLNRKSAYSIKIEEAIHQTCKVYQCGLQGVGNQSQQMEEIQIVYYGDEVFSQTPKGLVLNINNVEVLLKAFGTFQAQNFFCVLKVMEFFAFDFSTVYEKIAYISPPDGRMQVFDVGGTSVVIDFAHTPDALENVLKAIDGQKILVFGCGGNRDASKRKVMGNIACENSHWVVITNDNPRNENPQSIADEIASGFQRNNFEIILDRKTAIFHAIKMANTNQVVIIAGKGSEEYQIFGNTKTPYSDIEVVKGIITNGV